MTIHTIERVYDPAWSLRVIHDGQSLADLASGLVPQLVVGKPGLYVLQLDDAISGVWRVFHSTATSYFEVIDTIYLISVDVEELPIVDVTVSRADLNSVFGTRNIDLWADLDNDADIQQIANRVTWSISTSTALLKGQLAGSTYVWDDVKSHPIVKHVITLYAGMLLYAPRAVSDEEGQQNPMRVHTALYNKLVTGILNGTYRLSDKLGVCDAYPTAGDFDEYATTD